jgi:hypothetical protein
MSTKYRIETSGNQFTVFDDVDDTVGVFPNRDAALQAIERCEKEDAMWESAKLLVETAIKAHMEVHGVDRETSSYWINSALGGV